MSDFENQFLKDGAYPKVTLEQSLNTNNRLFVARSKEYLDERNQGDPVAVMQKTTIYARKVPPEVVKDVDSMVLFSGSIANIFTYFVYIPTYFVLHVTNFIYIMVSLLSMNEDFE